MTKRKAMLIASALAVLAPPATAVALRLHAAHKASSRNVSGMRTARTSNGVPEIGALYPGAGVAQHGCTASVVHSRRGNTLITAAHCVVGSGAGMVFAPGQRGAQTSFGRWTVTAAYLEPKWVRHQDSHADIAFLIVAPQTIDGVSREIEQVTGAYELGATAVRGQRVTITGYPGGPANNPITCTTNVYVTRTFPSFDCRGFVGGTSGAPWLRVTPHGTQIVGVIGGLNQGGCHDYTSYSSPLAQDADTAYLRALHRAPGDVDPQPDSDGC